MPDRQRVVHDLPFGQCLLVARPGLRRLGEILGEVTADEPLAGDAGHLFRGPVHVRDPTLGADRDQRIEARLEQAAGVERRRATNFFHPLALGNVAGRRKHPLDFSRLVAVHHRVVQDVRRFPRSVPDRQRIVHDLAFGQHLLVARTGLCRLREILREITADQPLAGNPGHLFGGPVHVRDPALGADRHQRIEAGLDQAAGVERSGSQFLFDPFTLGYIVANRGRADDPPVRVLHGGNGQGDCQTPSVFPDSNGFAAIHGLAAPDPLQNRRYLVWAIRRHEEIKGLSDDLGGGIAVHLLRPLIPTEDRTVQGLADNGIVRGFHNRGQPVKGCVGGPQLLFHAEPVDGLADQGRNDSRNSMFAGGTMPSRWSAR